MLNFVVFPDFNATPAASKADRVLLDALRAARRSTGAAFVNLSVFDYGRNSSGHFHYITYPMDWISRYVRNLYPGSDPFQTTDFRRVSHLDWRDLYGEPGAAEILAAFADSGLGRNGVTLSIPVGREIYCAVSFVFRTSDRAWPEQKLNQMALYRFEANRIAECFQSLKTGEPYRAMRLTPRETDVLSLAALGKTDDQIAALLGIAKWTVVSHVQSAKYKLGSPNRTAAVASALSCGLIALKSTA